ncbi:MAG TPA: PQQ-binding-like beta-propeller repeat protein, partial [Rhodopila sp.]|nr:PQQ-binding-like beta-propeller repeat protein [Rhodopila sp.]
TNVAAQAQFGVGMDWPMAGISIQGRNNNAVENTITTANVNRLMDKWTKFTGGFANASPFVAFNGNLYTGDVRGAIRVYSSTGALLWTAATGSDLESVTPVAHGGLVFFGAANGNVYAYSAACRRDGKACTPKWTKSVGTAVTGSLRVSANKLYVPSSDGSVHVLNPVTGAAATPVFGFDATAGSVTTPITFGGDGTLYYGAGSTFEYRTPDGSAGGLPKGGTVSPVAASNGAAYYTTGDGKINEFGGAGWSAVTSGAGCAPAPAVANGLVYAGGCTTLAAFEAGRGTLRWSVTTPGAVIGISVANGIAYACVNPGSGFGGLVTAYDASFGGLLWSGGRCTGGAPIIADGVVYAAFANITAYGLPGAQSAAVPARPAPKTLRPNFRLLPGKANIVQMGEAE